MNNPNPSTPTSVVPFGKYQGQPIESLLADANYLGWVTSQPRLMAMLQSRHPAVFNVITIGAPQSDDSPEHNQLQARFLAREFQFAFIEAATGERVYDISLLCVRTVLDEAQRLLSHAKRLAVGDVLKSRDNLEKAKAETLAHQSTDTHAEHLKEKQIYLQKETKRLSEESRLYTSAPHSHQKPRPVQPFPQYHDWLVNKNSNNGYSSFFTTWEGWASRTKVFVEKQDQWERRFQEESSVLHHVDTLKLPDALAPKPPKVDLDFECGYDIDFIARWQVGGFTVCYPKYNDKEDGGYFSREWDSSFETKGCRRGVHLKIEIKPQVGDDFPSVLRQMKRNKANTLVIGSFEATTCTIDEVRQMFGDLKVVTMNQIETILRRGVWPPDGVPSGEFNIHG